MPTRIALRNLTILLGSTTTVLAATIIAPALPDMATAFRGTPNAEFLVRLTLTMPALLVAIGAPLAGLLLDRWGRRPVLIVSLILYGVAGSAGYVLDTLPAILASRALLGLAVAGVMSGFTTLILDHFEGEALNRFVGYQGAFIGLGGMLFLLVAGVLADTGWRPPFLVHLFAFAVLPGVLFAVDEPKRAPDPTGQSASTPRLPFGRLLPAYLAAFAGMALFSIFPVQLPFHLTESVGVSNSRVGLALSLQTLSSVGVALLFARLKARLSFRAIFALIFVAYAVNHALIAATGSYLPAVIALLIGGLGVGLMPPTLNVWVGALTDPAVRGAAIGGLTGALFLGQFFSPILTQPLLDGLGGSATFAVAGGVSLALAALYAVTILLRSGERGP